MKVLLAEDDEDSRLFLETALRVNGYQVDSAADGQSALEKARTWLPELIVSDILMPRMDGFEFCRSIKSDPALANIPLVFYTATYTDRRDEMLALSLGAERFLIKPMEVAELLAELKDVLEQSASSDADGSNAKDDPARVYSEHRNAVARKLEKKVKDLEAANAALAASEQRFRQLATSIRECFWMVSADDWGLIYGSPAMQDIWGFSPEQRIAQPDIWLDTIHPDDRESIRGGFLQRACDGGTEETFRVVDANGSVRWLRDRAFPVLDESGSVYRIAGVTEDVSDTRRLSEKLEFHANHDALTGLINRRAFELRLDALIANDDERGVDHALCYMDLDQFKVVNDSCGHPAGDQLLKEITSVIGGQVRKSDLFGRLGGDEFAVLMTHCTLEQAKRLAQTILDVLASYRFDWHGTRFPIGTSIGLVRLAGDGVSVASVLAAADAACYVAKEQGGGRIHVYSEDDVALAQRHGEMRWVNRLNDALEAKRFELHYQTIHSVADPRAEPSRAELLLRLVAADGRLVGPNEFMPAAHRYHLTWQIDVRVLELACQWLAAEGSWVEECSINLCAPTLTEERLVQRVRELLSRYRIDGQRLCLEITETAALGNLTDVSQLMRSLRALGCRFAVDDFGSGFSSFAYLKALPIDYLKIDGEFVVDIASNPLHKAMVRSINEIGQAIGTQTIAEWVEHEQALEQLHELGVDYAQGFLLSRPRPCKSP